LFIVARVEYLRHYVELMVVVLGGLGQLRSDIEFLFHIESQACYMRGLELLREHILRDEHVVGLHTRDAARVLPLDLQLGHTALALLRDKHVVTYLEVRKPHVRLVDMLLKSSLRKRVAFSATCA
jgi:hypothetical protein